MSALNNRLHTDAALRASANGRSGLAWFLSQHRFQADDRAARVKRDVRRLAKLIGKSDLYDKEALHESKY